METGSELPSHHYVGIMSQLDGLSDTVSHLGAGKRPEVIASASEFVLEGLHLNRRLNRDQVAGGFRYRS